MIISYLDATNVSYVGQTSVKNGYEIIIVLHLRWTTSLLFTASSVKTLIELITYDTYIRN